MTEQLVTRIAAFAERAPAKDLEGFAAAVAPCDGPDDAGVQHAVQHQASGNDARALELVGAWQAAAPTPPGSAVALALRVAADAVARDRRRRVRLTWSGPEGASAARASAGVLLQLIGGASASLLLMTYASYPVPALTAAIGAAVGRGVDVRLLLDTVDDRGLEGFDAAQLYAGTGAEVLRWPKEKRAGSAELHAKGAVADGRRVLVTSANLTGSALLKNVELGVVLDDRSVAKAIEEQVTVLRQAGEFVPFVGE